jgi:type IV pilus assembly protein PilV
MPNLKSQKGFSLIEVLVAITLLSIGLLGVASMQTTAISGNSFARTGTEGVQLAQEMVDLIRTNAGTNPQLYDGIDTNATCSGADPRLTDCANWQTSLQDSGLQNISGTVDVVANSPIDNTATVTVRVQWGPSGSNRKVILTTILETWGT